MNILQQLKKIEKEQDSRINEKFLEEYKFEFRRGKTRRLQMFERFQRRGEIYEAMFVFLSYSAKLSFSKALEYNSYYQFVTGIECLWRSILYMLKMHNKIKNKPPKFFQDMLDYYKIGFDPEIFEVFKLILNFF